MIKINRDSSGAYVLWSEYEDNTMKHHMVREDLGRILFALVSTCVVGKNPNTPNWSSMADDAITQSGIGVLGSFFFHICAISTTILVHFYL